VRYPLIKLSANLSKKVPVPDVEFSSQQYGAAMEIEVSYRARMKGRDSGGMDEVLAAYLDAWETPEEAPIHFNKDESPESLKAMAERMLGAFLKAVRPGEILAVEESFAVEPVEGILVTGIVVLIEVIEPIWRALTRSGRRRPNAERRRREYPLRRRNCAGRL